MVLNFKKANCKDCYKCLRDCPVKCISVLGHQAQIIPDKCILCGHCTKICPQDAKTVQSNLAESKALVRSPSRAVVSLAPSFVAAFPDASPAQVVNALLALGFDDVEETAIGAKYVSREYGRMLDSGEFPNLITSACASVVRLIRIYHHNALKYLAPVDSPMVAHAKLIRAADPRAKIVFIGPCISKKQEADESGIIDCALTFEELAEWFIEAGIDVSKQKTALSKPHEFCKNLSLNYPVNRGIIKSFGGYKQNYEYICVDGVDKCREVLENIDSLKGFLIEMSACENACVNGPCMLKTDGGFIKATEKVRRYAKDNFSEADACTETKAKIFARYTKLDNNLSLPSESQLKEILQRIGKYTEADMLNCGACGYKTCLDKAVAVYNNRADSDMCLPFMRERAESLSSEIIAFSPNGIIAVDLDMKIVEINKKAKELLGLPDSIPNGAQLSDYLNPTDYLLVAAGEAGVHGQKLYIEKTDKYVELNLTFVAKNNMVFGIYLDITTEEKQQAALLQARTETVETANNVIEKQMRVVQEIASLLGETTAETQVALTKLKDTLLKSPKE